MSQALTRDWPAWLRWWPIWRRHFLAWRRYWLSSLMFAVVEPLLYMLGLGYGLGALVPELGGMSYLLFVASGTLAFSIVNAASFEAMYSAFARMQVQRTWDAILNAPLELRDVLLAEWLFAASKSALSCVAFVGALLLLGVSREATLVLVLPASALIGLAFAALALIMTALAKGYEFFAYWFSLGLMPLAMLSGVFFPMSQLPPALEQISWYLPMSHAVELIRPLVRGALPAYWVLHVAVLALYAVAGFALAYALVKRRFVH
ncbi:MAG: ABC transporter permease [Casimicrobiaceae bacterium]|nr:ABC transporter permease [Casimicrobiaceae bacterium]MDW8312090.1 ABC transporter permease [Burkholderiales bacterium]